MLTKLSSINKSIIFLEKIPDKKNVKKYKLWLNNMIDVSLSKGSKLTKRFNINK